MTFLHCHGVKQWLKLSIVILFLVLEAVVTTVLHCCGLLPWYSPIIHSFNSQRYPRACWSRWRNHYLTVQACFKTHAVSPPAQTATLSNVIFTLLLHWFSFLFLVYVQSHITMSSFRPKHFHSSVFGFRPLTFTYRCYTFLLLFSWYPLFDGSLIYPLILPNNFTFFCIFISKRQPSSSLEVESS